MSLRITKGGRLIDTDHYSKGSQENDVTDIAIRYLFEPCTLEEGVTLRDIFLLLDSNLAMFDTIIGNWCSDIVTEGLTKPAKEYGDYDANGIEYLELCYNVNYDNKRKTELRGLTRADFGGVGWELREDKCFDWVDPETGKPQVEFHKGSRIPWGVSMSPANNLINLPVKLSNKLIISDSDLDNYCKQLYSFNNPEFSLGMILYSIIWELSFFGGPDKREDFKENSRKDLEEFLERENKGND